MSGCHGITAALADDRLDGPGSHAHAVEDRGGSHCTSHASENADGATSEHDTFGGTSLDGAT